METVRAFNQELSSLYEAKPPISRAKMASLTKLAAKAIKFYKHVVQSVEKFILKCRPEYKVPGLYVIDAIVRQSRHQFGANKDVFVPRFTKNIATTFQNLFKCPSEQKNKIVRVLNLWQKNNVFSSEIIQPLLDLAGNHNSPQALQAVQAAVEKVMAEYQASKKGVPGDYGQSSVARPSSNQDNVSVRDGTFDGSGGSGGAGYGGMTASNSSNDVFKTVSQLMQTTQEVGESQNSGSVAAQQQQLHQLQLLQQQLLQQTQIISAPQVAPQPPTIDSSLITQIQLLTNQLLTKSQQQQQQPEAQFDKKLLDFDYGESDDEDSKRTPQQQPQPPSGVQNLFSDPALMQQIQQMSQTLQKTEQLKSEIQAEEVRQKLLQQQQEEFDQQISAGQVKLEGDDEHSEPLVQVVQPYIVQDGPQYDYRNEQIDMENIPFPTRVEDIPPPLPVVKQEEPERRGRDKDRHRNKDKKHKRSRSRSRSSSKSRKKKKRSRSKSRERKKRSRSRDRHKSSKSSDKKRDEKRDDKAEETPEERERRKERKKQGLPPLKKNHLAVCSTTIWIGHLAKYTTNRILQEEIEHYAHIVSINMIEMRGCAFVVLGNRKDAARVVDKLRGKKLIGNSLKTSWAQGKSVKDIYDQYWDKDNGTTYIPWHAVPANIDSLRDGAYVDVESFPAPTKEEMNRESEAQGQIQMPLQLSQSNPVSGFPPGLIDHASPSHPALIGQPLMQAPEQHPQASQHVPVSGMMPLFPGMPQGMVLPGQIPGQLPAHLQMIPGGHQGPHLIPLHQPGQQLIQLPGQPPLPLQFRPPGSLPQLPMEPPTENPSLSQAIENLMSHSAAITSVTSHPPIFRGPRPGTAPHMLLNLQHMNGQPMAFPQLHNIRMPPPAMPNLRPLMGAPQVMLQQAVQEDDDDEEDDDQPTLKGPPGRGLGAVLASLRESGPDQQLSREDNEEKPDESLFGPPPGMFGGFRGPPPRGGMMMRHRFPGMRPPHMRMDFRGPNMFRGRPYMPRGQRPPRADFHNFQQKDQNQEWEQEHSGPERSFDKRGGYGNRDFEGRGGFKSRGDFHNRGEGFQNRGGFGDRGGFGNRGRFDRGMGGRPDKPWEDVNAGRSEENIRNRQDFREARPSPEVRPSPRTRTRQSRWDDDPAPVESTGDKTPTMDENSSFEADQQRFNVDEFGGNSIPQFAHQSGPPPSLMDLPVEQKPEFRKEIRPPSFTEQNVQPQSIKDEPQPPSSVSDESAPPVEMPPPPSESFDGLDYKAESKTEDPPNVPPQQVLKPDPEMPKPPLDTVIKEEFVPQEMSKPQHDFSDNVPADVVSREEVSNVFEAPELKAPELKQHIKEEIKQEQIDNSERYEPTEPNTKAYTPIPPSETSIDRSQNEPSFSPTKSSDQQEISDRSEPNMVRSDTNQTESSEAYDPTEPSSDDYNPSNPSGDTNENCNVDTNIE